MTDQQYSILPAPPEKSYRIQLIDMTSNKRYGLFVPVAALVVGAFTLAGCNSGNTPTVAPVADSTLPPVPLATDVPAPTFAPAPVVPAPADVPSTSTSVQVAPARAPTVSTPATQSAPKAVTVAPTAPKVVTVAPAPPMVQKQTGQFDGTGMYLVGTDVQPGMYKAGPAGSGNCYWARLSSMSGTDNIIDNGNSSGQVVVQVLSSDVGLNVDGCATFDRVS